MAAVLGVELEAKNSDILVQRLKLRLDELTNNTDTKVYNKIFSKIYVTDGTNVLASSDLNSSTVVKDGSNYYITVAGFSYLIPKNTKKTLVVKADVFPNIDTADFNDESYQIGLAANGVRGIDGAGIDQYAGGSSDNTIARTTSIAADLADSANLTVSLATNTVKKTDVVATAGSNNNELDKLTLLTFNVRSEKDAVKVTDIVVGIAKSGTGAATASSTVYLFEGNTELDNASVSAGSATFSNFDQTVAKDQTRTFTVKVDIRNANTTKSNFVATVAASNLTAENTKGDAVSNKSGTATGNSIGVTNKGAEIVLLSKSVAVSGSNVSGNTNSTSTVTATFDLAVTAKGGDILMGQAGSTTPAFTFTVYNSAGTSQVATSSTDVQGTASGIQVTSIATAMPDGVTQDSANKSFTITKNNTANMRVQFSFNGRNPNGNILTDTYAVGISQVAYKVDGSAMTNTFMAGETAWTTDYVKP
jgi:hypothetical protein